MRLLKRLFFRTEGQDLIEYALLASSISVSIVLVIGSVGTTINSSYEEIGRVLTSATEPGGSPGGSGNGNGNGDGQGNGNGNGNSGNGNGNGGGNGGGNGNSGNGGGNGGN